MRVMFRCDASAEIGSGHVVRCLTLADGLARRGALVSFVCRPQPGDLVSFIERSGYRVQRLDSDRPDWASDAAETARLAREQAVDWLVVDHYLLDARFEERFQLAGVKVLAIDDLADRPHACDLLLDQNLCREPASRYLGLIPTSCRALLGPRYALLRPEFSLARRQLRERRGECRRLLISFGGSDPTQETAKALAALELLDDHGLLLDVVVGGSNPQAGALRDACAALPGCSFHYQVDTMAKLMSRADLALGSGGATTWERCFLGLPSLTVVVAANQRLTTEAVALAGATWNLGWHAELSPRTLADRIALLLGAPELIADASARAFALMGDPAGGEEHPLIALMYGETDDHRKADAA